MRQAACDKSRGLYSVLYCTWRNIHSLICHNAAMIPYDVQNASHLQEDQPKGKEDDQMYVPTWTFRSTRNMNSRCDSDAKLPLITWHSLANHLVIS